MFINFEDTREALQLKSRSFEAEDKISQLPRG